MYKFQFNSYTFEGPSTVMLAAVLIAIYFMQSIAYAAMFKKAGDKGWKGFVPLYNAYTQFKLTWSKAFFWIFLVVTAIAVSARITDFGMSFSHVYAHVENIAVVILFVLEIIAFYKLSKAYGHGIGYTIGLLFLTEVFMLTIGLGNSEYIGKVKKESKPPREKKVRKKKKSDSATAAEAEAEPVNVESENGEN